MTTIQGNALAATAGPQSHSRALSATLIAIAVLAVLILAGIVGARSGGLGSGNSFTPYDGSGPNSGVVDTNPYYPATPGFRATR